MYRTCLVIMAQAMMTSFTQTTTMFEEKMPRASVVGTFYFPYSTNNEVYEQCFSPLKYLCNTRAGLLCSSICIQENGHIARVGFKN